MDVIFAKLKMESLRRALKPGAARKVTHIALKLLKKQTLNSKIVLSGTMVATNVWYKMVKSVVVQKCTVKTRVNHIAYKRFLSQLKPPQTLISKIV